ncbi:hypothetical protein PMAYCL1PPCAC_13169, partial [Pristionchus mayeri]
PNVKLVTSDNEEFVVDFRIAKMSVTVSRLMEAMNMSETDDASLLSNSIPLPNVTKAVMARVIEWCEKHKNDEPKEEKENDKRGRTTHVVSDWDKEFLKNDEFGRLCQLMGAANYLEIKGLFNDISQTIANMIHGKKSDEIAEMFNIHCDLTEAEKKEIRKKTAWCED